LLQIDPDRTGLEQNLKTVAVLNNVTASELTGSDFLPVGAGPSTNQKGVELIGTDSYDTLRGSVNDDIINGMAGGDSIYGLAGDDQLFGGSGNDDLYGGEGTDWIDGGDDDD